MVRTWKWAVTTPQGIYNGELEGEIESGESWEHAMQTVSAIARQYIKSYQPGVTILACFVSNSALHIDAPDTTLIKLDIETEIPIEDAGK